MSENERSTKEAGEEFDRAIEAAKDASTLGEKVILLQKALELQNVMHKLIEKEFHMGTAEGE